MNTPGQIRLPAESDGPGGTEPGLCVHTWISRTAASRGAFPALTFQGTTLTHDGIESRSNQLAAFLLSRGVKRGDIVAIHLERSPEMLLALVAVLKAGAAYLPVDPSLPAERAAFILEDAGAAAVLTTSDLVEKIPASRAIAIDRCRDAIDACPSTPPGIVSDPSDPAYLIYTSGSTGKPKGVEIPHRACVNLLDSATRVPGFGPSGKMLAITTLSFDLSFPELILPLVTGGRIVLADRVTATDGASLRRLIETSGVDCMQATPATWKMLLEAGWQGFPSFKIVCGGEPLQPSLARRLLACGKLWNLYGPSETTVWSTAARLRDGDAITIGKAIDHTRIHLLDPSLRPVPDGEPGEIHIAGSGLATGYHRQPALTAERFFLLQLPGGPAERVYKTGDLARRLPDGRLEYLGRIDRQIKLRGHRIEPAEIETALLSHSSLKDAAVTLQEDDAGEKRLLAFFVPASSPAPSPSALRDHLQPLLPGYMIPAAFIALPALPLTPSGKTDHAALPSPSPGEGVPAASYVAPRTSAEETLASIFREVLHLEKTGVHDHFFHLGGHSLTAMRAVNRINRAFSVRLPLSLFFAHPTVASLAGEIPALPSAASPITSDPGEPPVLSPSQTSLWLIETLHPGLATYNITEGLRLRGPLDPGGLRTALQAIAGRHEVLRMTLHADNAGDPHPAWQAPFSWTVRDLSAEPATSLDRVAAEEASRPFDLAAGPPFRAVLCRLAGDDHVLLLSFHHLAIDQWSLQIFMRELDFLYRHPGEKLPGLPLRFRDFARWQLRQLASGAFDPEWDYWRSQLHDAPPFLDLPLDHPRPPSPTFQGKTLSFSLPVLPHHPGATPFAVLLAAFHILLARWTGRSDIITGTPAANRPDSDLEPIIGYFVNMLPLRTDLSQTSTFSEVLDLVSRTVSSALQHQSLPFPALVERLNPPRSPSRHPVFQIAFVLREQDAAESIGDLDARPFHPHSGTSKFDLTLSVHLSPDNATATFEYNTALFSEASITHLGRQWLDLLENAPASPGGPWKDLPLFPPAEEAIPSSWTGHQRPYPHHTSIGALFTETALAHSHRPALAAGDEYWTYLDLLENARKIAAALHRHQVLPGEFVAIAAASGFARIAAIAGIQLHGATCVPIDPTDPDERIFHLLRDSGSRLLLTDEETRFPSLPVLSLAPILSSPSCGEIRDTPTDPSSPAFLFHTSGTTGHPKGVIIPQRAVIRLVKNNGFLDPGPSDIFLQASSIAFDASTFEIWGALLNGATLVLPLENPTLEQLARTIRDHGVTTLWLTSGLFQLMIEEHLPSLSNVRHLLAGGDILSPRHVRLAFEALPRTRLVNGYGPTENTTFTTCHPIAAADLDRPSIPIGKPVANTTVFILDENLRPVPPGIPGELFTGGDGLAAGYHNDPDLTASRFIDHPRFGRLYRTGDLCRWLPDGVIEFIGRADGQVKIRGFRVETSGVEAALLGHPSVTAAKAAARGEDAAGRRLAAWVTPSSADPETLRRHLQTRLPAHLIPSAILAVERFPLTRNGKIDTGSLPDPFAPSSSTPPSLATPTEKRLAAIWSELLSVPEIDANANWFQLGGHSLLALKLFSRIHREFGRSLPLASLLHHPTLRSLASAIEPPSPSASTTQGNLVTLSPGGDHPPLFCIHGGDGGILFYRKLPAFLPREIPVLAIESPDLSTENPSSSSSIIETAGRYLDLILSRAPQGPYLLCGYSFGGVVAREIACQLTARGHRVAFLGLFDTYNLAAPHRSYSPLQRLGVFWKNHRHLSLPRRLFHLFSRTVEGTGTHLAVRRSLRDAARGPSAPHSERRRVQIRETNWRAMQAHQPGPFPGALTLFKASSPDDKIEWPSDYGWSPLATSLEIVPVPGRHLTLFDDENLPYLARELASRIHHPS